MELCGCLIAATSFFDPSPYLEVFNIGVSLTKAAMGRSKVNHAALSSPLTWGLSTLQVNVGLRLT